jgi:hypothetical protein
MSGQNTSTAGAVNAGPGRAGGYVWAAWTNDAGAHLQFAPPESDNSKINFVCAPGSGRVTVTTVDVNGRQLILRSGHVRGVFRARVGEDDLMGRVTEATLDVDEPVMVAFRQSGELAEFDPPAALPAATPSELQQIQGFFTRCA